MKARRLLHGVCFALLLQFCSTGRAEVPESFRTQNLVAWCIVPFDAKKRTPSERAAMVRDLGLKRVAYDWRNEHVSEFEEEILAYKKDGIEFTAFWRGHDTAFPLFERHSIKPAIWAIIPSPKGQSTKERVESAADSMEPLARKTQKAGLSLGLYNHGGWSGLPSNMVAVAKTLRERGFEQVGIVYNFHHSHPRIQHFQKDLKLMLPYLLCINLNGMLDPALHDVGQSKHKIQPIGAGSKEVPMIKAILDSGYEGDIGILGHVRERDVEVVLRENIEGLAKVLAKLGFSSEN